MKVKCSDCGAEYDHTTGDYSPTDVCQRCFDNFDGLTIDELLAGSSESARVKEGK
jgi:hypothetical protein